MPKKVAIIGGNPQYAKMFHGMGYETTADIFAADLIQFTGGADVSPFIYGEARHPTTHADYNRDIKEAGIFAIALRLGIPMAGICRGAQFLNAMSGGSMWQDVDNHAIYGTHEAKDLFTGKSIQVTSTHHQMMRNGDYGEVLCTALESTIRHSGSYTNKGVHEDLEAIWYPNTKCLCFQPHPEFDGADSTREYYFDLLKRFVL